MPSEIFDCATYSFYKQDEVLLDANIWLMLQCPLRPQPQKLLDAYTSVFEQLLVKECVLVMTPLVLSEFVNRYARFAYDTWGERWRKEFKEYRSSDAFKPVAKEISKACSHISQYCERSTRHALSLEELEDAIAVFGEGEHDFNDLLLAQLCRRDDLILITHDGDFAELEDLTVVTANRRLFA